MKKIFLFPLNFRGKTQFILSQTSLFPFNNFIYITSNYCKIQDFKIKIYKNFANSSVPMMYTLKSLVRKIIEEKSLKRIISDVERYLLLLEIIKKKEKIENSFTIQGIAQIILNFIKELKTASLNEPNIEKIKKEISNYPWKFEKNLKYLEFAIDVLEKYQEVIKKQNFLDEQDIYNEASKFVYDEGYKNIVFENILEIPPYQRNFVSNLIKSAENFLFFYFKPEDFPYDTRELIIEDTLSFIENIEKWERQQINGDIFSPKIECFNFTSKEEEIKGIIRLIEKETKGKNLNFDDFLITCPDILNYRNYIKRIFSRYNIPVEIIPGYSLIGDSSISSIFEIFTFSETYDWTNLMNILTSPYFKNIDKKKIEKFSRQTREKYQNSGFYREDFLSRKDKILEPIKKCINLMEKYQISLKEWSEKLNKIIEILGWEPHDLEIKMEFENILDKLKSSFYCSKEEFVNIMRKLIEMVEVEEGKGEGIRVSGVIESLGIEKEICFFCGATEENFPNAPKIEEFFLPDRIKKNFGLDYFEKRVARDRGDFYRLKNEHQKVIFTYPSKIEEREQMKSLFIFEIEDRQIEEKFFSYIPGEIFKIDINPEEIIKKYSENGKFKISVSGLEALFKCPFKFYLKNIKKIKPYEIPQIKEVPEKWGQIVHMAVEKIFKQEKGKFIEKEKIEEYKEKFEYHLNKLEKEFLEEKVSYLYRNVLNIRKEELIRKFTKVIENHAGNILIDIESKIEIERENFILKGKIDIIEKTENGINIIDIKTGTGRPPSYTKEDFLNYGNMQIPLYVWIYCFRKNLSYDKLRGIIWDFSFKEKEEELEKVYEFVGKKGYLDEIEDYLNQKIIEIKEGKIIPEECEYYCDFKRVCPYEK